MEDGPAARRSKCEIREYPWVEHLTIVQIATPDVLDFFCHAGAQRAVTGRLSYGTP